MKACVLASGSKGNVSYVASSTTQILVDLGTTSSYAEKRLLEIGADDNEIYLAKLYVIGKGKQFLTLAWGIVCENLFTYLPIAEKDWSLFDEYDIGALLRERAVPGIPIKMHGKYFTPLHDPKDGWCLACSKELRLVPRIG